jgi:hypothetical protein
MQISPKGILFTRIGLFATAGTAVGLLVWVWHFTPALLFILFPLWGMTKDRYEAFSLWLGYYLAGSYLIPSSTTLLFWLGYATVLASCWTLFTFKKSLWKTGGMLFAWLIVTVPPIGVIGWINPALGAGWIFTGYGWTGLALYVAAAAITLEVFSVASQRKMSLSVVMAVFFAVGLVRYPLPYTNDAGVQHDIGGVTGWIPEKTKLGTLPATFDEQRTRQEILLGTITQELAKEETTVVILPEEIVGTWSPVAESIWKAKLPMKQMRDRQQFVMVGAQYPTENERDDSLLIFDGTGNIQRYSAVQPDPFSLNGDVAHWGKMNRGEIHGVRFAVSFGYEDFLTWPVLRNFAVNKKDWPMAILSIGSGENDIQQRSIHSWAYLFNASLLSAANE